MDFVEDHPIVTFAVSGLLILGVLIVLGQTFIQGSIVGGGIGCEYQVVDAGNQTYSNAQEYRQAVEAAGGNWSEIEADADFRVRNGVLEARLSEEECEKLQQVNDQ